MRTRRGVLAVCLAASAAALLVGCRPPEAALLPPSDISGLEGYVSLRLSGEWGGAKSRVGFQIQRPGSGRLEVLDPLGRVVFTVVIIEPEALLAVPSEKAFCLATRRDILDRFLGFSPDLEEWAALVSGLWGPLSGSGEPAFGWEVERDGSGRVVSGRKGGVEFEVREFHKNSLLPRRLAFRSEASEGLLTVLRLRFNPPLRQGSFSLSPPPGFEQRTLEEMERLFRRED